MVIGRILRIASIVAIGVAAIAYGFSYVWPSYSWDMRLESPNGSYDIVVLRQDAAAFSDLYYVMYVFPHGSMPKDKNKNERVLYASPWRSDKYRVYSGTAYPMFRWLNNNTVEISLDEAYFQEVSLWPIKKFSTSGEAVLVSLVFGKGGVAYAKP
jgi:hypothetical protein